MTNYQVKAYIYTQTSFVKVCLFSLSRFKKLHLKSPIKILQH